MLGQGLSGAGPLKGIGATWVTAASSTGTTRKLSVMSSMAPVAPAETERVQLAMLLRMDTGYGLAEPILKGFVALE